MAVRAPRQPRPDPGDYPGGQAFLPEKHTLPTLRQAVTACKGCPLYRNATHAVFGEGLASARVMLIGEQPGDSEDLAGKPFVGPSGRLLDAALQAAGIPRSDAYVTNVVKHFKYTQRGKRRIHDKPNRYEITACKPWLAEELEVVEPDIVVLLGATAAQALLGGTFRVTKQRGQALETELARWTFATVHPSSVLRAPDEDTRRVAKDDFFHDLGVVGQYFRKL
ncbi:MAG: putative polymerase related protein [Myxococcales bacterium]|nr:putative polymerase related protein [Myxococcales bacterium]